MEDDTNVFLSKLIFQGESILAEITRLSEFIPKDFKDPAKSRFKPLLVDFKYFGKQAQIDNELAGSSKLQHSFYELHNPVIISFELLFDAISEFVLSFRQYCSFAGGSNRLDFHLTTELEVYCLYTCGLILLYLEKYLPAPIRERIYVAIYRKSDTRSNAEFLVDFLKAPKGSSDSMIKRAEIPTKFVDNCIDLIEIGTKWQFSKCQLMYVALQFSRQTMGQNSSKMNRIVNSIYREEWAFNLGFGLIVDVFEAWYYQKAAWNALNSIINNQESTRIMEKHIKTLNSAALSKNVVDLKMSDFEVNLRTIGSFNNSLKWLMLHSRHTSRGKTLRARINERQMFQFLLDVSNFELKFLEDHRTNLKNRETSAKQIRSRILNLLGQLVEYYQHGLTQLNTNQRENVVRWIKMLSETVSQMDLTDSESTAETAQQIQRRIKQASDLLGVASNFTLKEHMAKIDKELKSLASFMTLSASSASMESVVLRIDSSYLWPMIDEFVVKIQENLISTSNTNVVRQIFTKFGIGVIQMKYRLTNLAERAGSGMFSNRVANTWSYHLEAKLRVVLQCVPQNLFKLMHEVITPMVRDQHAISGFLDKTLVAKVEEERNKSKIVKTTWAITNTSLGISRMMLRKVGTVRINPRQLLEDGMEKQLAKEMKKIMNGFDGLDSFNKKCAELSVMRSAFIYMCEFMNVDGHGMWAATIEHFFAKIFEKARSKENGKLFFETNPVTTRYSENRLLWTDLKSKKVQFSFDMLVNLEKNVPFHALTAMENAIFTEFDTLLKEQTVLQRKIVISMNLHQFDSLVQNPDALRSNSDFKKLVSTLQNSAFGLAHQYAQLGQLVLMLKSIGSAKRLSNRMRENSLYKALQIVSKHLVKCHDELPESIEMLNRLFMHYSLFRPENLPHTPLPDVMTAYFLAFCECVVPKIGESGFVCPKQLLCGLRFVVQRQMLESKFGTILHRHLIPVISNKKNLKRAVESGKFVDQLVGYSVCK